MIRGNVRPQGQEPVTGWPEVAVPVSSVDAPTRVRTIDFLLDTGFTGHLTLPLSTILELGLPYLRSRPAELADGSTEDFAIYAALADWDGQTKLVPVFASESRPLLGMAMLWGSRLAIDAWGDGDVIIT